MHLTCLLLSCRSSRSRAAWPMSTDVAATSLLQVPHSCCSLLAAAVQSVYTWHAVAAPALWPPSDARFHAKSNCTTVFSPIAETSHTVAKEQYCDPTDYYRGEHAACFAQVQHHYHGDSHGLGFPGSGSGSGDAAVARRQRQTQLR